MSRWVFEPFAARIDRYKDDYSGPRFGVEFVWCPNERGVAIYFGPWYLHWTFLREPMLERCDVCEEFHTGYCDWF